MSIKISEIFGPTIQGEGALIGQPTIFVRMGGCDYRCSWCDSMHAVDSKYRHEWETMSANDIFENIEKLSGNEPLMISLSGGNPAIQDLKSLIDMGHGRGYKFALETQGSIAKDWFADLDILTLSPKPPSSGEKTNWNMLDKCLSAANNNPEIAMKIVIMNDDDYTYARSVQAKYPQYPLYLQPANHSLEKLDINGMDERMLWLIDTVMQDKWFDVRVLPQLHVMLWGNKKGV